MSINIINDQPTDPLNPTIHCEAMIHEEELDDESGYSHVYLTSVTHYNTSELRDKLKRRFMEIGGDVNDPKAKEAMDKSFEDEVADLNMEKMKDKDEDDIEEGKENAKKDSKDMFLYALSVSLLSGVIQLAFIITIIKEYLLEEHVRTGDPELISIRILAMMTLSLKIWIELGNGSKIVKHGIYQGFLYQSRAKRIVSIFMGIVQIITGLTCFFCSCKLIVQTETVIECVKDFSALIILTEIDNWIGEYFLKTSKDMKLYTRDYVVQIYVLKKKDYFKYTFTDFILHAIYLGTFVVSIIPIFMSIEYSNIRQNSLKF